MSVLFSGNCRSVRDPKLLARFLRGHFRGRHLSPARHLVAGTSNFFRVLQVSPNLMFLSNDAKLFAGVKWKICVCFEFPSNSVNLLKIKAKVVYVKYAFSLKKEKGFFHILFLNFFVNLLQSLKKMATYFLICTHFQVDENINDIVHISHVKKSSIINSLFKKSLKSLSIPGQNSMLNSSTIRLNWSSSPSSESFPV